MKRIALFVLLVGCGTKASEKMPTCAEVTDHVLEVAKNMYPGHGDMGAGGNRQTQIEACEARNIPAAERKCMLAAKNLEAIGQCRRDTMMKQGDGSAATAPK